MPGLKSVRPKRDKRMTADEWDKCHRSDWMLLPLHEWLLANPVSARTFDRKLRLYAVACCHQRWELFETDLFQRAVDAAERLADGRADKQELAALYDAIMDFPTPSSQSHCIENMTLKLLREKGIQCVAAAAMDLAVATGWGDFESVVRVQAPLLRCVVGNPFRLVRFDTIWRTSAVERIAEEIYAGRDFSAMPILADALMHTGCNDEVILAHCRSQTPHVRGCWVVDLLLRHG